MSYGERIERIREGLERKHFADTDVPQWKRDRIWDWAYNSMSEAAVSTEEEFAGIKRSYAELAELVTR